MDHLLAEGKFTRPDIRSLEKVLEYGINLHAGRVFADLWDLKLFSKCEKCFDARISRLNEMNLSQSVQPEVDCSCEN
jgi:hypothetical protein